MIAMSLRTFYNKSLSFHLYQTSSQRLEVDTQQLIFPIKSILLHVLKKQANYIFNENIL